MKHLKAGTKLMSAKATMTPKLAVKGINVDCYYFDIVAFAANPVAYLKDRADHGC